MKLGIDYVGGRNYVQTITRNHPPGWAAGFLCYASGWKNGIGAARALAKTGKCPIMRIAGVWRDDHSFTEKDIPRAVRHARQVARLSIEYPEIKFLYSPWLEHRADNKLFRKCKKACREVLPRQVQIVCCGPAMPRGINEVHHGSPLPGKYIFSYDGKDMFTANVRRDKAIHSGALYFFAWIPRCNGRSSLHDTTPRHLRHDWLTAKDIRKMVELTK
jgi:hypothetical protein